MTQTPNLQRPDYRALTRELGPAGVGEIDVKDRLILSRFVASRPMKIWIRQLERVPIGYAAHAVVLDGPAGDTTLGRSARTTPAGEISARRAAEQ